MKTLHIIIGLDNGGAEAVLFQLTRKTQPDISHFVVSFLDEGIYGKRLRDMGIPVETLNLSRKKNITQFYKLVQIIKRIDPDIVQTWMYHADLLGGFAAKVAGRYPVVWGMHHSNLDKKNNKLLTRIIAKLSAMSSGFIPYSIISCSQKAAQIHQNLGYKRNKFQIIPNGYDLSLFHPDPNARRLLRETWEITESDFLIGLIGRWNAQKDHHNLIQAISLLKKMNFLSKCVFAGPDMCPENSELLGLIEKYDLNDQIMLLGPRNDIPDIMNALDLHVLPSAFGEAFPNVVSEAMASGTPCVVTDVGDAAYIVGDTGWVVPPKDPVKLANAIENASIKIKESGRATLGVSCRERIQNNFSLEKMADAYVTVWKQVLESKNKSVKLK